jgi:hypothetical protein
MPFVESGKNGSLPLFRRPAYFNPMTRKATGLFPDLGQTAVWPNACQPFARLSMEQR